MCTYVCITDILQGRRRTFAYTTAMTPKVCSFSCKTASSCMPVRMG